MTRKNKHGRLPTPRPMSVRDITIVGAVAFSLFTLLNASSLLRIVERQPFGWSRTVQVALVEPIDDLSHFLHLDRPRLTADEALGRSYGNASAFDDLADTGTDPDPGTESAPTPTPGQTTTTTTALPEATAEDPLTIWIVGDSQAETTGQSLIDRAGSTGVMAATLDFEFSSGLTRPDFFNWPAQIQTIVEQNQPDVMVVVFGANDGQGMELEGGVFQPGQPEWNAEYTRRVEAVMAYLEQQGIRVYWIGQPVARVPGYSERMRNMNAIFETVAADHANTVFVPLYDLFLDESGNYSDYLTGAGGELVNMRNSDGIHLTRAGGDRAADVIFGAISGDLPGGVVPVPPTTVPPTAVPPTAVPAPVPAAPSSVPGTP